MSTAAPVPYLAGRRRLGLTPALLDHEAWTAAATQLAAEGFSVSVLLGQATSLDALSQSAPVWSHHDKSLKRRQKASAERLQRGLAADSQGCSRVLRVQQADRGTACCPMVQAGELVWRRPRFAL
jgi:hypothetical protein